MESKEQSIKAKLKQIVFKKDIRFNELWLRLVLERFLFRISGSKYSNKFILKGGFLLSQYIPLNRETKDLDFSVLHMETNIKNMTQILNEIVALNIDDGLEYRLENIERLEHQQLKYPGVRVLIDTRLGKMRQRFPLDIGIGDPVDVIQKEIHFIPIMDTPIFSESVSVLVYPLEYIFAEKLETSVYLRKTNSRMKDFHDLYLIINNNKMIDKKKLKNAIENTFKNRESELKIPFLDFNPDEKMQLYWKNHVKKIQNQILPELLSDVFNVINIYTDMLFKS